MRIEASSFEPLSVQVPIQEPGREEGQAERKKEENTPNSDYMYALSVGSLINVQV
ncbi:hypothetical protein [Leptospira wolffii]|uniref:hypothetical protein n=1 Tax=Leptospira wolffii TaxID=409998 RepID=UPI0002F05C38|nr:hypothetical protein [Leptospira wolffii]EPG68225.1 hypothetical protein LEP1GSC061_0422 [Leptospira wolffii serovar Khorat str. Khorat-H2]